MSVFWMYAIPASPFGGTALSWPMMGPHATLGVWGAAGCHGGVAGPWPGHVQHVAQFDPGQHDGPMHWAAQVHGENRAPMHCGDVFPDHVPPLSEPGFEP